MSKEIKDIPDSFHKWAKEQADEKHECRGDMPDSFLYEAAAANEAYIEGALDAYHHLSPSSKPEIGLRWVKASERVPEGRGEGNSVFINWNGKPGKGYRNYDDDNPQMYFLVGHESILTNEGVEWLESIPSSEPAKESRPKIIEHIISILNKEFQVGIHDPSGMCSQVQAGIGGIESAAKKIADFFKTTPTQPQPSEESQPAGNGVSLIAKERREQIEKHGRTLESDKRINADGQLCWAAALLTRTDDEYSPMDLIANIKLPDWNQNLLKKMDAKPYKDRLIIAGALIAAELDRLLCANQAQPSPPSVDHIHVQLPSGGIANVSPDASPELMNAIYTMTEMAMERVDPPSVKPEREDNWISIKESPEEYRQVLLWFEGLKTIAIGYLINGSWADENKNLLWCEPDHWAAMPTPPSHPSSAPPAVQQEDKRRGLKAFDDSMKDTLGHLTEDNPFTGNDHQEDGEVPEDRQEAKRGDLVSYYKWIKTVIEDKNDERDDESLAYRLAREFQAHVDAVYEGGEDLQAQVASLRSQLSAKEKEINQLNEYRKEGKRYSEMLEEKITNLHRAISALRQEKEDYRKAILHALEIKDLWSADSYGEQEGNWENEGEMQALAAMKDKFSELILKYTPQTPTK